MEMLMRRESCLPYRCTASRRAIYAVLFLLVVAVSGGLLGIAPTQAQTEDEVNTTAAEIVIPSTAAASQPKPKKDSTEESVKVKEDAPQKEQANALQQAVQRGTVFLRNAQRDDGAWLAQSDNRRVGMTALCTLALLKSGMKVTDAPIQNALTTLRKAEPKMTYGIALQTLVFCAAEPKKDLALIQRNVGQLEASQLTGGTQQGGWTYRRKNLADTAGDNSNSGFAIWALDEATHAGAKVKPQTWDRALSQWRKGQRKDGSWSYMSHGGEGTGSMTCTGIASLAICLNHKPAEKVTKEDTDALDRGIVWLTKNFAVNQNPGSKSWTLYYLMKLRHVGEQTGVRRLGDREWYTEMAVSLQKTQNPRDGSWHDMGPNNDVNTALALLALQSGPPPRLAAEAGRTWGVEGRVVDELNEPVVDTTVIAQWVLGGKMRHSVVKTDQRGHFMLVYPPPYLKPRFLFPSFQAGISDRVKVIEHNPLVLQVPRYRMQLQGIWKVVSWEQPGKHEKPDEFKNRQLHIDYNTVSVWDGHHKVSEESYRINPAIRPQQIALTARKQTQVTPGIFRLKGNKITLCLNRSRRGFPSKFASEVDSPNEHLIELERYDSLNLHFPYGSSLKPIQARDVAIVTRCGRPMSSAW